MEILARKLIMAVVMVGMMTVMTTIIMMNSTMGMREMKVAYFGEGNFSKRYRICL